MGGGDSLFMRKIIAVWASNAVLFCVSVFQNDSFIEWYISVFAILIQNRWMKAETKRQDRTSSNCRLTVRRHTPQDADCSWLPWFTGPGCVFYDDLQDCYTVVVTWCSFTPISCLIQGGLFASEVTPWTCLLSLQVMTPGLYHYYVTELAFYWSLMFSQFTDIKRKVRGTTLTVSHLD